MEIAKGVEDEEYKKFNLDINNPNHKDWDTAFGFLEKRFNERFIEPANLLIKSERNLKAEDKKYGFTILAIDFLLTETLQCFYEGITDSTGQSRDVFARFLTQREFFKKYFKSEPEGASFYKKFRCGILHQAQTASDTKVWAVGKLISQIGQYTVVNRDRYHELLLKEKDGYFKKLRLKKDLKLLRNFKSKMDFICGISK